MNAFFPTLAPDTRTFRWSKSRRRHLIRRCFPLNDYDSTLPTYSLAESNPLKLVHNCCVNFWFNTSIIYGSIEDKINLVYLTRKQKRLH